jgi:diguanylate cyclase (GGDEF)-like protein/PAS domain S-box-containing protein
MQLRENPIRDHKSILPKRLTLWDLISLEALQQLQDSLAAVGDVQVVIADPVGNLMTMPSNERIPGLWMSPSEKGAASDGGLPQALSAQVRRDLKVCTQRHEPLGIRQAAIPIIVGDKHLANWWIAQDANGLRLQDQVPAANEYRGLPVAAPDAGDQDNGAPFAAIITWVEGFTRQLTQLGLQNLMLARQGVDSAHSDADEEGLEAQFDSLLQARTEALIVANKRLQLEVLERDLLEEQNERKTALLDAMNRVLQQTLNGEDEKSLVNTFLEAAQALTRSPIGFIVQRRGERWWVMAALHRAEGGRYFHLPYADQPFPIGGLWKKLVKTGSVFTMQGAVDQTQWYALPEDFPELSPLLAVALPSHTGIEGFVALANNGHGYGMVDQTDVQTLSKVYVEALLRKRSERARRESEQRLLLALESADEGLWDYFPQTTEIYYSPRWFGMLGYASSDLPCDFITWTTLTHPDDLSVLKGTFERVVKGTEDGFRIEIRMLSQSGQWHWVQTRGRAAERDATGQVHRISGTLIDVSKYKQVELALQKANQELQRLAALDDLTQIANRRRFDERLAEEWRRARRNGTPLAVIICDIDFFKAYNDTYGHIKGDEALHAVAQAINGVLKRPMDLVARYGGEEFAMVLPSTDLHGALRVATEVREAIGALGIEHRASSICPTISLSYGVTALVPRDGLASRLLVERADLALYQAKTRGRNCIVEMAAERVKAI